VIVSSLLEKYYSAARIIKEVFGISYLRLFFTNVSNKTITLKLKDNVETQITLPQLASLARLVQNKWRVFDASDNTLTLKGLDDVFIKCRTTTGYDFGHLIEIYLSRSYGEDFSQKNVIDIGMSNADSSIYFAKKGARKVIGLEPDRSTYELAMYNIKHSKVDNVVIPINKALSSKSDKIELIKYDHNPNANSIDENNMVLLKDLKHKETVEGISLENIISMFGGEEVHLLKMDCEGCEYSVLRSLREGSFKNISEIIMEYHNGLKDLKKILQNNGFKVQTVGNSPRMGYIRAKKTVL